MRGGRAPIDQQRREHHLKKYGGSFEHFVLDIANWMDIEEEDSIYRDRHIPHFRPQHEYLYDDNGSCLVDFIGKIENIENDFEKLCHLLSIDTVRISRKNRSYHRRYWHYYNAKTRAIVAEYYARDIKCFGYRFREPQKVRKWLPLVNPRKFLF